MQKLALLIATLLLAGCQTVNSTWGSISGPDAPKEQAPPPAAEPAPPVRTAMAPAPTTSLRGQSGEALQGLWGEPSLRRKDLGSELWQYAGKGCTLLIYLYPTNGVLTVNHVEAVPGGQGDEAISACAKAAGKQPFKPAS
jgi:hypothetical protein